ncbi:hypothetical protein HUB97_09170 [Halorubraceae archaeon YAN]|nr:hypothetical protein [Halorubraceae archaeon YAN]
MKTHTFDWKSGSEPSVAIVTAVADTVDKSPSSLPPLQQYIEVDSIDTLLLDSAENGRVIQLSFTYAKTDVTVTSDGYGVVEYGP